VEFDDNRDVSLRDLGVTDGSRLIVTNDNDDDPSKNYCVVLMIKDCEVEGFKITGSVQFKTRPKMITEDTSESLGNKRKRSDDEVEENSKKLKEIIVDDSDTVILL
jgi:hypothetical protein